MQDNQFVLNDGVGAIYWSDVFGDNSHQSGHYLRVVWSVCKLDHQSVIMCDTLNVVSQFSVLTVRRDRRVKFIWWSAHIRVPQKPLPREEQRLI